MSRLGACKQFLLTMFRCRHVTRSRLRIESHLLSETFFFFLFLCLLMVFFRTHLDVNSKILSIDLLVEEISLSVAVLSKR